MMRFVEANGAKIPAIGLGTWNLRGREVAPAIHAALDAGYRHIDTAAMYANETEIGAALESHDTPRSDIWLTTKVWRDDLADGRLQKSAEASANRLKVKQVDLLLIHWPARDIPLREQVRALCKAKKQGLARHIGVSNFSPRDIEETLEVADEPIVTNQIENHPWTDQRATFEACASHGISITSYSPLGKARNLDSPVIVEIARAKGKTSAQVVLCWHIQQPSNIAIPKSSVARRIAENIEIFDFSLSNDEMRQISDIARGGGRSFAR
jgi:diketogulonate reductase-like aldo/keto reductase